MFDIIFLSYDEPKSEKNWKQLKQRFPRSHRVHGIKGILSPKLWGPEGKKGITTKNK